MASMTKAMVKSLTPISGSTTGVLVTIKGIGLSGATAVLFGAVGARPTRVSNTAITVMSPNGQPPATVHVKVNLPTGSIPAGSFTYVAPPTPKVTGLSPTSGPTAGGTLVTIAGQLLGTATSVQFNKVGVKPISVTEQAVTALSPAGQPIGPIAVSLDLPTGLIAAGSFTYVAPPSITTIEPVGGPNAGGTMVTVTGSGFTGATGVLFGSTPATGFTVVSDKLLTAVSSAGSGSVDILVTNSLGTSPLVAADQFHYATLPLVFTIPANVASRPGGVFLTMYGQLAAAYTNGAGTAIANGSNVYLIATPAGYDYAPSTGIAVGTHLTPFLTPTTALHAVPVGLPNVALNAGRVVVGVGSAPIVTVNDTTGDVTAPTPSLQGDAIYDFFEFSYLPVAGRLTLTINTSAIDQYGLTIQLAVAGQLVTPPHPVGVLLPRETIVGGTGQFAKYVAGTPFAALTQDSFGNSTDVRVLSSADQFIENPVQGVAAAPDASKTKGTLSARTTYSYVMTALAGTQEAAAPCQLVQSSAGSDGSVAVSWGPATTSHVTGYKIYRATPAGSTVSWALVTTIESADPGSYVDTGGGASSTEPPFASLYRYLDPVIGALFTTFVVGGPVLSLTVTDGSNPANGLQYNFIGTVKPAPAWLEAPPHTIVLEFNCTSIANNPNGITPLIPTGSLFYVVRPFFNTNALDPEYPSPPSWVGAANMFPTAMAFGARGVFADNVAQSTAFWNKPQQPAGLQQAAYSVAVGAIENQIDAALLRGIATTVNSVNWANAPTDLTATAASTGNLPAGQDFWYVVTTLNAFGESSPSSEAGCQATGGGIALAWAPVANASGYNIYRGSLTGQENQLIGSVQAATTGFTDTVASPALLSAAAPTSGAQPAPAGVVATLAAGGTLPVGQTDSYVVTALGLEGESVASSAVSAITSVGHQSVALTWQAVANTAAYKIYRRSGGTNALVGTVPGSVANFTDNGSCTQVPPPIAYYAPGTVCDRYAEYFHQTTVSAGGLAYASPFDDQGDQSSTITAASPRSVTVTLAPWS